MTMHVNPLRLAVMFDGDESDIKAMAREAVGQLAETAKGLGRDILVRGAQTMDVENGSAVNWSDWVTADAFDKNETLRSASCYRGNGVILGALHPLAVENENLLTVNLLAYPPRFTPTKIDAVLIATGRDMQGIGKEFSNPSQLDQILNGMAKPEASANPLSPAPFAGKPIAGHRGFVEHGTGIYSLATILGVADIIQEKLSAPTGGMSFHGKSREIRQLVDAMAVTLADPDSARKRLAGNRFAKQLEHSKA